MISPPELLRRFRPVWVPPGAALARVAPPVDVSARLTIEGTFRAHQVPLGAVRTNPRPLKMLERWMKSYGPKELLDGHGTFRRDLAELAPTGDRRLGANPHANGGLLVRDLRMPDFRSYAVAVPQAGTVRAEATRIAGALLRDIMKANADDRNFRVFGPDETASNRLTALFDVTDREWTAEILTTDDHVSPDGRVMELLSEHLCQGWLEGYRRFATGSGSPVPVGRHAR